MKQTPNIDKPTRRGEAGAAFDDFVRTLHLPRYAELPDIELYMDQVLTYIDDRLQPLFPADEKLLTSSMVNNYVKQRLIPTPSHKRYGREHVALLIFICLMILTNAILQTYGKEKLPIFTVIVGGIVKIIMNYFLVGNPDINIHGAPISTLCCYLVIVVLNLFFVWKYSPQKPRYLEVFAKPVAASLLMGGAAWAVYGLASRVLDGAFLALAQQMFADPDKIQLWSVYLANAACVLLGILAGVIVYGVLVIALRILRAEDVRSIPRGEKLIKLLHLK